MNATDVGVVDISVAIGTHCRRVKVVPRVVITVLLSSFWIVVALVQGADAFRLPFMKSPRVHRVSHVFASTFCVVWVRSCEHDRALLLQKLKNEQ